MAKSGLKPSGKCSGRESFEESSSKKIDTETKKGKFYKQNHQCYKSKNEKESPWLIFLYSKTEIRGTFIFSTEARIYLLLLSCSNVFPLFGQQACCYD